MRSMKKLVKTMTLSVVLATAGALGNASAADLTAVPSGSYTLDQTHAYIGFSYSHLGLSNPTLGFDDFTVDLNLDSADATKSMFLVKIDPASIITGSAVFKEHLAGADWFDSIKHPEILFQSTSITAAENDHYTVVGDLTIKDVTKPVTLDVTVNAAMNHPMTGKPVIGIDATGELLRSDFGLGAYAPNVSDEVKLNITAELNKAQ